MKKWHYIQINELENKKNKSQKAFTLIELLIVIAVI
jgi:competence protein ComGC